MQTYIVKGTGIGNVVDIPGPRATVLADNRAQSAQRKTKNSTQSERAADVVQAKTRAGTATVQLEKKKRLKYTVGGGIGLGVVGAGIGSIVPGVGTLAGGLIGALVGGIGGYLYSKPKIYTNMHKGEYQNELLALKEHQHQFRNSDSEYQRGTIIKYSKSKEKKFLGLLGQGNVLYTYDENSELSIGSGVGPMKHAIVAGNKNVKAAGWAKPRQSKEQSNEQEYQYYVGKLEFFEQQKKETEAKALLILQKHQVSLNDYGTISNDSEKEIVGQYKTAVEHLELYGPKAKELLLVDRAKPGVSKNSPIELNNESGHYHPGNDTKGEAFEGWKSAGFTNLTWKPWHRKNN